MHTEQRAFIELVKYRFPGWFVGGKVLEIGSYNVNGSIRDMFENPELYVGLDLAPGKDVDVVEHGADYDPKIRYDVVISTEALEHDSRWRETFSNMIRLTKQGGLTIFTCAAKDRPEHGTRRTTPTDNAVLTDYYENRNAFDFEVACNLKNIFVHYALEARENDLYFYGIKR